MSPGKVVRAVSVPSPAPASTCVVFNVHDATMSERAVAVHVAAAIATGVWQRSKETERAQRTASVSEEHAQGCAPWSPIGRAVHVHVGDGEEGAAICRSRTSLPLRASRPP